MFRKLKEFLTICNHDWEIYRKQEKFVSISGEQLYRRCKKCGKIEKYIYREFEENG